MTPTHYTLNLAQRAGLSNVRIAAICNVHPVTVSRWKHQAPSLDTIAPLLVELDLLDAAVDANANSRRDQQQRE